MVAPKVALVHDWITTRGGGELVLASLREIYPEADVFSLIWNEEIQDFGVVKTSPLQPLYKLIKKQAPLLPFLPQAVEMLNLKGYDLVISTSTGFVKGVITHPDQTHLCYLHAPIRYAWGLSGDDAVGRMRNPILRPAMQRFLHHLRMWDVASSARPDVYWANSETTKGRIAKIYRRESEVVYPPVDVAHITPGEGKESDGYFLSIGRLVSYKRVDLAIQACLLAGKRLIVAGAGEQEKALRALANGSPLIEFKGRVSTEEKLRLLQGADALLFGAEEDFGIVPVEAMAAGRPVLAYGVGGASESVVAGETGEFFMGQTSQALAELLGRFSVSNYDSQKIRARAEEFSPERFKEGIEKTVKAYGF